MLKHKVGDKVKWSGRYNTDGGTVEGEISEKVNVSSRGYRIMRVVKVDLEDVDMPYRCEFVNNPCKGVSWFLCDSELIDNKEES